MFNFGLNLLRRGLGPEEDDPTGAVPPILPKPPTPAILSSPSPAGIPGGVVPGRMPGAPSPLPETVIPSSMPLPTPNRPPVMGAPTLPIPTREDRVQQARDTYLLGTPGRFKSGVLNAVKGGLQGLTSGGGLGGLVGGALAGGAFGGINPRGAREQQFNELVKPKILEGFALEDAGRAQQLAAEKAEREDQTARANILNIGSQIQSRNAEMDLNRRKFETPEFGTAGPGAGVFNKRTGQVASTIPAKPTAPTNADVERRLLEDTGDTIESLSRKSLAGRLESLKGRMTLEEQRLAFGGATDADDPRAITRAQSKWQKIQDDELNSIRRDTPSRVRAQYGRGGGGSARPTGQGKAIVGPDFVQHVADRLGISPEKARQRIQDDGYTIK